MAAEAAKFRQPDFSDCHWCTQLLHAYKGSAYTEKGYASAKTEGTLNPWALRRGSALELVLRAFVNAGPTKARKLAAALAAQGEDIPSWMKLPTDMDWQKRARGPQPHWLFDSFGFICGEKRTSVDGD